MVRIVIILISLFSFVFPAQGAEEQVRIIPQPLSIKVYTGQLNLNRELTIKANNVALYKLIDYTIDMLRDDFQINASVSSKHAQGSTLIYELDKTYRDDTEGAYSLSVKQGRIKISAKTEQGLFYGLQTLRQLIDDDNSVQYMTVKDAPRFTWRAFMLDESRHFKGSEQVKKLLDEMARLKMNVFHWHLVDDQGWRIEIKKYPLLTDIGAKRKSTQVGPLRWQSPIQSGEPHGGFYTQEDIRDIIDYAEKRHITIVPEIEMPGHSSAAIAAYPWLGSSGNAIEVPTKFGVGEDVYNVANPKVYKFLTDVLDEVMALFPSKVIHIGGDEVRYNHWEASAEIQAYMKKHGLDTPADLQVFFTNRISQYLESKGRRMMGWNEIMGVGLHDFQSTESAAQEPLASSSVVHFWKGDIALMKDALGKGFDVVNSLHSSTYLDYHYQGISLKQAYAFDPIPADVDKKYHAQVKGLGCQMWSEWIPTIGEMDFMVFPRIAAYAEVGWTATDNKHYNEFKLALEKLTKVWQAKPIYFAPLDVAEPDRELPDGH